MLANDSTPPKLGASYHAQRPHHLEGGLLTAFDLERRCPEAAKCGRASSYCGWEGRPNRIMHPLHLLMALEMVARAIPLLVMPLHAHRQGLHAPKQQEPSHRGPGSPDGDTALPDLLHHRLGPATAPATRSECPLRYFVQECITMSAPMANGLWFFYGAGKGAVDGHLDAEVVGALGHALLPRSTTTSAKDRWDSRPDESCALCHGGHTRPRSAPTARKRSRSRNWGNPLNRLNVPP